MTCHRIFLSYSREAGEVTAGLANDLEAMGHTVWYDVELHGGLKWWDSILTEIRLSSVFIFALTNASLRSDACRTELRYALAVQRTILPILLDNDCKLAQLPPPLHALQILSYLSGDRSELLALAAALNTHDANKPLPHPLPEAPALPVSYSAESIFEMLNIEVSLKDDDFYQLRNAVERLSSNTAEPDVRSRAARRAKQRLDLYSAALSALADRIPKKPKTTKKIRKR